MIAKLPRQIPDGAVHRIRRDDDGLWCVTQRAAEYEVGRVFNRANLEQAVRELGIQGKVSIRLTAGRRTAAAHRGQVDGNHRISVSSHFPAAAMSENLWHELQHAAQCEREGGIITFYERYRAASKLFGYHRNIYEVEAREAQQRHQDCPLVSCITDNVQVLV